MNMQEYMKRLKALTQAVQEKAAEAILVPAVNEYLANKINTIVQKGEKSDGSKIGQYSTKPMYASKDQFVKKSAFKPIGKRGKKTPPNKTMYLPQGYKQLRDIQGRPTDKVNLFYSGDLISSFRMVAGTNYVEVGLTNEFASKKKAGNEKRFGGAIFQPQKNEMDAYKKNVTEASKLFMQKIMGNV